MGGHIAAIGGVGGGGIQQTLDIAPSELVYSAARIQGLSVGSREMMEEMLAAMAQHSIRPAIDRVLPRTEAARAVKEMADGSHY